jgi:uncharacterized protein YyaL (SSP411 family)
VDGTSRAKHLAYAADHASLVDAFTRLGEATGQARWTEAAIEAADALLELFWDDEAGGVFTTGHDAERLVARQKDLLDGATPSASSMAALGLLRLAALTDVDRYRAAGQAILATLGPLAGQHPTAFSNLLAAVDLDLRGATQLVIPGDIPDLVAVARERWRPNTVLAWGEPYDSPLWEGRSPGLAYVCRELACRLPVATPAELRDQLGD